MGSITKPDDSNDLKSLDGGVMGEGGCPSRAEVKEEPSTTAEGRSHGLGI